MKDGVEITSNNGVLINSRFGSTSFTFQLTDKEVEILEDIKNIVECERNLSAISATTAHRKYSYIDCIGFINRILLMQKRLKELDEEQANIEKKYKEDEALRRKEYLDYVKHKINPDKEDDNCLKINGLDDEEDYY